MTAVIAFPSVSSGADLNHPAILSPTARTAMVCSPAFSNADVKVTLTVSPVVAFTV